MIVFLILSLKIKWWLTFSIKMSVKSLHFCLHKGHIRYVNIVVYLMCLIVYLDTSLPALRVSSH